MPEVPEDTKLAETTGKVYHIYAGEDIWPMKDSKVEYLRDWTKGLESAFGMVADDLCENWHRSDFAERKSHIWLTVTDLDTGDKVRGKVWNNGFGNSKFIPAPS